MVLSKRLQCIADFIPPGARIIDVGTDHAYIPIRLLLDDPDAAAVATDIRPGPLQRAQADAEYYGVADRLTLLLGDGLKPCTPESGDTIILAGMGGETMIGILSEAPWAKTKRLILQPQTKIEELRGWLSAAGYAIRDAALVHDAGRLYLVWYVEAGEMPALIHGVDSALVERRDGLLKQYLEDRIKRLRKRLNGVSHAREQQEGLAEALRQEIQEMETMHQEASSWKV